MSWGMAGRCLMLASGLHVHVQVHVCAPAHTCEHSHVQNSDWEDEPSVWLLLEYESRICVCTYICCIYISHCAHNYNYLLIRVYLQGGGV